LILVILLGRFSAGAQTIIYSQSFTNGTTPSSQCTAWNTFCSSLLSSYIYTGFSVSSSISSTTYTCTNGTVATAVANAMRTASGTTQSSDGHTWYVGTGCGSGCGGSVVEFAVDQGTCACGTVFSLRPAIANLNWGGMGTTCSAASQTLTMTFYYQAVTFTGGNRQLTSVCAYSTNDLINSLLVTSDPTAGASETISVATPPVHGTLGGFPYHVTTTGSAITPSGLNYTPTSGYSGLDSFVIQATDGVATSATTIVVTVNPSAAAITGTTCVVQGSTIPLSDPTTGGTWSSSSANATISSSGVVTGVTVGTATISYLAPGAICPALAAVTVSSTPAAIAGARNICSGGSSPLTDAGSGVWTSSNSAVAAVGSSSGLFLGASIGTATITYTLPTTCYALAPVTVNTAPGPITGLFGICQGTTTTLSNLVTGGTWTSSNSAIASINASTGLVTGNSPGTVTITYTAVGGCVQTVSFTVNSNPAPIGSIGSGVCQGSTTTLTDATSGGIWSSSNIATASVDLASGVVSGYLLGSVTITYTIGSSGCKATAPLTVNPEPAAISGVGTGVCMGSSLSLTDGTSGGTWTSSNILRETVGLYSGAVTGVSVGSATITYALSTGCYALAVVPVNQLPVAYNLTGGGSYCPSGTGVHIGLSYSETGVTYQLYLSGSTPEGSSVTGSSASIDFGLFSILGTYTAIGTNSSTGCSNNMTGSKSVSAYIPPIAYDVTGGGGYCPGSAGTPVGTDGSQSGVTYQLYGGSGPIGPALSGSGSSLSFGTYSTPGTYTVLGTSTSNSCTTTMNGNATIYTYPAPTLYIVGGNGGYCAGTSGAVVSLSGSDAGSSYQLLRGSTHVGSAMTGTGDSLYFPPQTTTGVYTIEVTDGVYACTEMMTGSSNVVMNPLPTAYSVTGGGSYCSGTTSTVHIGMGYSSLGINYELISPSSAVIATVPGANTSLDFGTYTAAGTYTAVAINTITGCAGNMTGSATVNVNTSPSGSYNVLGGGSYCLGGIGEDVYADGSQSGIHYQLYKGSSMVGSYHTGSGGSVDFGLQTSPGTYTVVAVDPATSCATHLTGSASVIVNPLPPMHLVSVGGQYCSGGTGIDVNLNGSDPNVQYQLLLGGSPVTGGTMYGTGPAIDFGMQTSAGSYTVSAIDTVTGCNDMMTGSANVTVNPLPAIYNMTGGGSYCAGGAGVSVGLDGSSVGISYKLYDGSLLASYSGTGSALSFGTRTSTGAYTVVAMNLLTGCVNNMNGLAMVSINPLPATYYIEGGGNFCAGGSGVDVYLSGSDVGVNYQLSESGTPVGPLQGGSGTSIDFGPQTGTGVYTVLATNASTTCYTHMSSPVIVNTVMPTPYTVTGGGSYCSGGPGVNVVLSGSSTADAYQLYVDGVLTGPVVYGTGAALDFGLQATAGAYTVVAQDNILSACMDTMASAAIVNVDPLPAIYSVTGTGSYCLGGSGLHVGLSWSSTGISYQLYSATSTSGAPVSGSGSSVDFGVRVAGSYLVIATDAVTHCADTMSGMAVLNTSPLPNAYAVTALDSGYYCATDSGVHIWLSTSDAGITYQLYRGTTPAGSLVSGTGSAVDLGLESVAGSYTVFAVNATSTCSNTMANNVNVAIIPLPTVHDVIGGGGYCLAGGDGVHIGLDHSDAGIYYTLYNGVSAVDSLFGIDSALDFGLYTATGTYTVVGNSRITYCPNNMFGSANVFIDTLLTPNVLIHEFPSSGVGVWRVDSVVVSVTNGGSSPSYQWYINGHLIAGATSATFANYELFNNDSVSCSVTASGPCGGLTTSKYVIVRLLATGVNTVSVEGSDVKLIPNPNKGTFSVKGSFGVTTTQDVTLEVTNMLGQVLYTKQVTVTNGNIDEQVQLGGDLANGMYLLNLRTGSENTVFHFVIEQ
jgi:uncharacterized protein YjdB